MFEPVEIEWKGETYTVPADQVMGLIATVEDVISLPELLIKSKEQRVPMAKLSKAYAAALRYAGAKTTDEDVYQSLFAANNSPEKLTAMITGLMSMMIPPDAVRRANESAEGNVLKYPRGKEGKVKSSKRRTKAS